MERSDILVIGGGIAGCMVAWFLARAGGEVTLIERFDLHTLASGSNAGSLHLQMPAAEFRLLGEGWAAGYAPVIALLRQSLAMWAGLGEELGVDLELATPGGLIVATNEAEMDLIARKAVLERRQGLDVRLLARDEVLAMAPYLSAGVVGGALCVGEGKANPLVALPAIARAAAAAGVRIHRHVTLEALKSEGEGFTALTSRGPIAARRVVDCAGAEAGRVAGMLGLRFAVEGVPIQVSVSEPVEPLVEHLVYSAGGRLTLKQTRLGAFLIGGGWPAAHDAQGRPAVDPSSLAANLALAVKVAPPLAGVSVVRTWPCIVNGTADWRPLLGEVPGTPGFFMCMFPWTGFTAAPAAARLVADAVIGRKPARGLRGFLIG